MTSVLLLPIPESSVLDEPVSFEVLVVVGNPVEAVVSVGIVSITKISLDVPVVGAGVDVLDDGGAVVVSAPSDPGEPVGRSEDGLADPDAGMVSVVVVVVTLGNNQGGPFSCRGLTVSLTQPSKS
jgi:hypothetical protein